jgi:hypothetical protein
MERAARVLGKLKFAGDEKLAQAAWPLAVGKRLADRTGAVSLNGSRLVVLVEDKIWQQQLHTMRGQIVNRIEQVLGRRIVETIEFRIAVPRPKPQREESFQLTADEADTIANPILRRIYKTSRQRATG